MFTESFVKVCEDEAEFEWIKRGREPFSAREPDDSNWPGVTVWNLLPDIFPAHAKIFHRLEANYDSIDNSLSEEEEKILQRPESPALQALVERLRKDEKPVRVRWKEVAAALDLPFAPALSDEWFRNRLGPGCWPRFIWGPGEGYLEPDEYAELVTILTKSKEIIAYYFRLAEIPFVATDQELLFKGMIDEVNEIPTATNWKSPEYWWPGSHEWCVCSDYDLSYTVVGGPRRVISEILSSDLLEAIEVTPDTRVDYLAPIPT